MDKKGAAVGEPVGAERPSPLLHSVLNDQLSHLIIKFEKMPRKRLIFFTLKGHADAWKSSDRVVKWLRTFASLYIFVQSPKGGIHYHGLAAIDSGKNIRYIRNIHMKIEFVGSTKSDYCHERAGFGPVILHPVVPGDVGINLMLVNRDIDEKKSSLPLRIKHRKAQIRLHQSKCRHIARCVQYLRRNLLENKEPTYHKHLKIKAV